ncbi:MAG: DUF4268 domain-containing protein [Chloroflexi bacterium]|nr:DUF4268 domain-containing protein [Chloroflexota bacterium]
MADIGTFKSVDVRAIWPNEASDFTPWLADHMDLLGEALGLDLEVERMEASVGSFSLDILARDPGSDRKVVIENQLEATDHDHLGKLLTYAAYFKAHVIVWLAREFRPEHRAVFDWLNDRTDEQSAFFAVKVEAWRIDCSAAAPRFVPVASPNEWEHRAPQPDELSERRQRYRQFFQALIDELREAHQFTNARVGQPQNWYQFRTGFPGVAYSASFSRNGRASIELYIDSGDKDANENLFDQLLQRNNDISESLGEEIEWERLDNRRASRLGVRRPGQIEDNDETLGEIRGWMIEVLLKFRETFPPHLDELLG